MLVHALLSAFYFLQVGALEPSRVVPWVRAVDWHIDVDADNGPWEAPILDSEGREQFRVALVPLWAFEGNVVSFEIALARGGRAQVNLLGQRQLGEAQAFVIDANDLKRGIAKSQFGRRRTFSLPGSGGGRLEITIVGARLGKGAGVCNKCPNIGELKATVAVRAQ